MWSGHGYFKIIRVQRKECNFSGTSLWLLCSGVSTLASHKKTILSLLSYYNLSSCICHLFLFCLSSLGCHLFLISQQVVLYVCSDLSNIFVNLPKMAKLSTFPVKMYYNNFPSYCLKYVWVEYHMTLYLLLGTLILKMNTCVWTAAGSSTGVF
jgi:hypothetical protein